VAVVVLQLLPEDAGVVTIMWCKVWQSAGLGVPEMQVLVHVPEGPQHPPPTGAECKSMVPEPVERAHFWIDEVDNTVIVVDAVTLPLIVE